jgi:Ca2+-binding EF-hand superfamily protein
MADVFGKLYGSGKMNYKHLISSLDRDGNGVIDYQEFITAAVDKASMMNKENLE